MKTLYVPEKCECCKQTKTYLLAVDQGTVDILKAMTNAVRVKGVNMIHPRKEMEVSVDGPGKIINMGELIRRGQLTSNQVGNLSRARFQGLIARLEEHAGYYCITRKGGAFLRGESIPRFAIISKTEKKQIGYYNQLFDTVNIRQFGPDSEYWIQMEYNNF